jgi:sugar/nucleoside kinase (ribokinase family)
MPEVVVVGNIGIDTNVYLSPDFEPRQMERREGAFTTNVDGPGQAGGFASAGYARLGRRTGFLGAVGDDPLGRWIEDELRRLEIEPHLFIDPAGTSRSVNLMRADGTRNNFYDGKSHFDIAPEPDAVRRVFAGARLAHFHIPDWARHLVPVARELGLTVACDLQDVTDPADPYRREFIEGADFLFASAVDAGAPEALARALSRRNPRATVVLGLGRRGAGLWVPGEPYRELPPATGFDPVVDTNGAGDSLAVGFLVARVLEGRSPLEALRWGQIAARHACTLRGNALGRLITRAELDARLSA